jgi:MFS family permease
VTAAVWCLYVLAATQILSVVVSIAAMGPTIDATREYVEGKQDGDAVVMTAQIGSYASLVFGLLFAVGLAVLAVFVNRGNQPARIVSWVVLGLLLCCNGFGALGAAAGGLLSGGGNTNGIDQEELTRRVQDAVPGWVTPVNYVLLFVGIVVSAAGIILLALPAANTFFRRPQPVWEPPVPGAYYPAPGAPEAGAPAAPAAPGAPAPGAPDGTTPESVELEKKPDAGNPPPAL